MEAIKHGNCGKRAVVAKYTARWQNVISKLK